ncbi:antibiotic biosynthesis monooxygenase [Rhodoferax sp. GW822-FHT02A01]|uniref:antibiotic biosynthesis monooxygenase family protein n=1 Tax=Rhodoferax sp. GW822-FHT02A01 TaxID=3141537 RepID=UPI00315D4D56
MIAVIFEVTPLQGMEQRYFDIAVELRESLQDIDGFVSVERFQSLTRPGTYLSLSYWRDEEAVRSWRRQTNHRAGQAEGRARVFADYRIRVAQVVRDYTQTVRDQAPHDSNLALQVKE